MHPEPTTTNGRAIRKLRKLSGLKLYQLADLVGVSDGYLGNIEKGRRQGAPDVILTIAQSLGVRVADITHDEPELQPVA